MMQDDVVIIENYFNRPTSNSGSFEDVPLNSSLTNKYSFYKDQVQPIGCFWVFNWFYNVLFSFWIKKT